MSSLVRPAWCCSSSIPRPQSSSWSVPPSTPSFPHHTRRRRATPTLRLRAPSILVLRPLGPLCSYPPPVLRQWCVSSSVPDQVQHPIGRQGKLCDSRTQWGEGVGDGVEHSRRRADSTTLAHSLVPTWAGGRSDDVIDLQDGNVAGQR